MGREREGRTAPEVVWEAENGKRGSRSPSRELSARNLGEAAESRKPRLPRNQPLDAAFTRSSCVTLARSLFSLRHGCLICQMGMEGPAQSALQSRECVNVHIL